MRKKDINKYFKVIKRNETTLDKIRDKSRRAYMAPSRWVQTAHATACSLVSEFMINADPEQRSKIQKRANMILGSYYDFLDKGFTYADAALLREIDKRQGNAEAVWSILRNNREELSHKGLNVTIVHSTFKDSTVWAIPVAIEAFMAKKEGLEKNFTELFFNLLCNAYRPEEIHKDILNNFIDKYNDQLSDKMLLNALDKCKETERADFFQKLTELNEERLSAIDGKIHNTTPPKPKLEP